MYFFLNLRARSWCFIDSFISSHKTNRSSSQHVQNLETHILLVCVCETRHITMRLRQHKFFAPTQRVTRPPTKGSELPSRRPDLPPLICQNTEAGGGGERKVTPRRRNKTTSRFFSHSHLSYVGRKSKSQIEIFCRFCCKLQTAIEFRDG